MLAVWRVSFFLLLVSHQVLEDQQEVNEAIAGVELPGSEVSAADLEVELNNLLAGGGEQGDSKLTLEQNDTSIDDLASSLAAQSLDSKMIKQIHWLYK